MKTKMEASTQERAAELSAAIHYAMIAHAERATKPSKAVRKWDGITPYGVHPVWCAMSLLQEPLVSEELRWNGALALLFHDVLEDTTAELPRGTSARVAELVDGMTFESSDEEMVKVWDESEEIRLLKLYDKVSNLLDGAWMNPEKRERYLRYTELLAEDVEKNFGNLGIVRQARAL